MLTAGVMLRDKRLKLKLTFTSLSQLTKISPVSLRALEKNQFSALPAYPFLKGMVQNYAKALDLDPVKVIAVFKRDYDQQQIKVIPTKLVKSLGPTPMRRWLEQPLALFLVGMGFFALLITGVLWRVYQPPRLVVDSPQPGQTAISPVAVAGKTDRDASLSLNGRIINLAPDGSFATTFEADPGTYQLVLRSSSRRQKINEQTITVIIIQ